MSKVLFVSVHPDDETFGCGGTIFKYRQAGEDIYWLNITGIYPEHPYGFSRHQIDERNQILDKVKEIYCFNGVFDLKFPTIMLDTVEVGKLVAAIDKVILDVKPDIIFIPNRSDVHSDHKVAFNAIYSCTKNFRKLFIQQILMYEALSETEFTPALAENAFIPNYFVDITDYIEHKIEVLKLYNTELMPDPLPRSLHAVKGLAAFRGSRIGAAYAEAFMMIFERS